jgi:hypothetical protein
LFQSARALDVDEAAEYRRVLEWLRREAGQKWVENAVAEWRRKPAGRPSEYPEDDFAIIKIAYLVVHAGLTVRKAIIAVIGEKAGSQRYNRLLGRCRCAEGNRQQLREELRWFAEQIRPGVLPADMPEPILDADELLKQKP